MLHYKINTREVDTFARSRVVSVRVVVGSDIERLSITERLIVLATLLKDTLQVLTGRVLMFCLVVEECSKWALLSARSPCTGRRCQSVVLETTIV